MTTGRALGAWMIQHFIVPHVLFKWRKGSVEVLKREYDFDTGRGWQRIHATTQPFDFYAICGSFLDEIFFGKTPEEDITCRACKRLLRKAKKN